MGKIKQAIFILVCLAVFAVAAVPANATTYEIQTVREKRLALSVHGGTASSFAVEYGFSENFTLGYSTGDGIFLKGFVLGKGLDIYGQISSGSALYFKAGLEINLGRAVFCGVEFASMDISNNSSVTAGINSGFIGFKF